MPDSDTVRPLGGPEIIARARTADGVGSQLDADLVRGRAQPTDALRFDPYGQQFAPTPFFAETQSLFLFGV
jgi:hypothetical protein